MHYFVKYSTALLVMALLFSSCRKEPKYDDAPEIEFKRVDKYSYSVGSVRRDSLVLVLGYKDGDGNLGLRPYDNSPGSTDPDSQAPFNFGSPYYNNFVIKFFEGQERGNGEYTFTPYLNGFQIAQRFPRISNEDVEEPLEGEIRYSYVATEDLITPGTVFRFEAQIFDRTTPVPNASNLATSEPVILFED